MAQARKQSDKTAALQKQIADLKATVAAQQKALDKQQPKARHGFPWRGIIMWLSVALATVLLVLGNMFFWAGNTIVNTDRYVAAVGPLIEKPPIQSAIAQYTTKQIFNNVNVQSYVQSALPPKIEFLAPQLTSQLKSHTQSTIQSLLANPKVQSYWYSSLTRRHQALISFSKSYQGNGTIQVSDIYAQLSKQLETTNLAFLANKPLPANVGSIKVATAGWLPVVHKLATKIGLYQALSTLLLLGFSALAVFMAAKRRRMVITLGLFFAVFMLLTLVSTRIAGGIAASEVAPAYQTAVQVAYNTVLHSFVLQTVTLLLLSLLVVVVAWLSGPYKSAKLVKTRLVALLSGRLHQSAFGNHENGFTRWVGKSKRYLEWGSVVVVALIMLLVQLSPKLIVIYGLLILLCILVIEFLGTPQPKK